MPEESVQSSKLSLVLPVHPYTDRYGKTTIKVVSLGPL